MRARIGKFEVERKLGEGAMGEVYLARDPVLGRPVAVKVIHPAATSAPDARDRFFREAQAAGRLSHPNLVTVHEFGEDEGAHFLVMEYVEGEDLATLLRMRALTPRESLEVIAQVCEGLGHAHAHGVLHRDVKPSNVRVARISGRLLAKVMDFGIARLAGSDMTGSGMVLGTFGYMAPEYIQTGKADARADLFAAGVMLYEALAGFKPFEGDTSATVLYRVIHDEPKPLDAGSLQGISPATQEVLRRSLAKAPEARFPSGEVMAEALRGAMDPAWRGPADAEATVRTRRPEPPARAAARWRRWPWLLGGMVLLLAAGGVAWWMRPAAPKATPSPRPGAGTPGGATPAPRPGKGAPPPRTAPEHPPRPRITQLDEAEAALDRDPRAVLAWLEQHLAEQPGSERGHALRTVALYELGRYEACVEAMKEGARQGFKPPSLARTYPRYRAMVEQELRDPKLPRPEPEPGKRPFKWRRPGAE